MKQQLSRLSKWPVIDYVHLYFETPDGGSLHGVAKTDEAARICYHHPVKPMPPDKLEQVAATLLAKFQRAQLGL